jgi:hypothetical protein
MFGMPYVDSLFLYFQSRAARKILSLNMRKYGDGLDKFEPNDLNDAMAPSPDWFDYRFKPMEKLAMEYCERHNRLPSEAEKVFDELVSGFDSDGQSSGVELLSA